MEAIRVLRFSGPSESAEAVRLFAIGAGIDAHEMVDRAGGNECWLEISMPLAPSSGVDGDQVVQSLERTVERVAPELRLREYVTEVRGGDSSPRRA